jgi:L-fuculose-phosphate aldolase
VKNVKKKIIKFAQLLYRRDLVSGTAGNISLRVKENEKFIITPTGISLRELTPEELIIINSKGEKIKGKEEYQPSQEASLHLLLYTLRSDVNAVIHAHPPYATAFSIKKKFPLLTLPGRIILKRVECALKALPGSADLVRNVSKVLKGKETKALLLQNHGSLTFGKDLEEAFNILEVLEEAAKVAFLSHQLEKLG